MVFGEFLQHILEIEPWTGTNGFGMKICTAPPVQNWLKWRYVREMAPRTFLVGCLVYK